MKNETQFAIARDMLKKNLRELSKKHPSFYYSLETLSTFLDIDYNLLVDLYEYLSELYVTKIHLADEILRALHTRGIRNIVYTRSDPAIEEIKLTSAGLREYIDTIISLPETFGILRGTTVFEKIANHIIKHGYASSKDEILLVTPNLDDYLDAHNAGLRVVWFSKYGELRTGNQILTLREIMDFL